MVFTSDQLTTHLSWLWQLVAINNKHHLITNNTPPLFITISLLILAILLLWSWSTSSSNGDRGAPPLPPGPFHLPIIGYLPFLGRNFHTQFTDMARTYGPIFKVKVGTKLSIIISSAELAKAVVRDQDETFANRPLTIATSLSTYGGQDIAWSNHNSSWRKLRKIFVQEVLSTKNLESCSSLRKNQVRKTIQNVYSKIGTSVDLNQIFFSTIANVLTSMIWQNSLDKGADYDHLGAELEKVVSTMADLFGKLNAADFFPSLAWFDLQGVERDIKKAAKKLDDIITSVIDYRIKLNSKNNSNEDDAVANKDVLQILLDLKDQKDAVDITILDIKALLTDIMVAGPEATTLLIEWTMVEMMQNPKIMKKVQEELLQIVGPNNIVEESHLSKLKYLDATIKETFRLHPVVPLLVPRSPSKNCTVGGYTIPKGCTVFVNVWAIHRDPRYWDNPLEFNPERFLGHERVVNKYDYNGNNLNFFPFGSGRRVCVGLPLAEKSQMLILASLLHSFDWSLPKGEELDLTDVFCVTLRKEKPLIAIPSQRFPNTSLYT